tara:strand:- start:1108 stop:2058 length:951 start_codon:yes stop_codon:yes gene_type:complete
MYLPEYAFEMNDGLYQQMYINQAIEEYVPSTWGVYKQSASYAFHDSSFFHAGDYASTFDDRESNQKILTEEEWREKGYDQSRQKYREGITENQAQILQQIQEREKFYGRYMKNTSILSVGGITGMITGSLVDPINYIPFVGWAGRISKVARLASKMPILGMSANAMIGQTAFETVKQSHLKSLGRDVHWAGAMIDVGIAGILGAGFGGLGKLSGLRKKINSVDPATHDQNMAVALTQHGDNIAVDSMQGIGDPNPVTTLSPSKELVINDPVFRQEQIKRHQTTVDRQTTELDVDPIIDANIKEEAIRSYNACKGVV